MSNDKNSDNEMGKIIPLAAVGLVILAYIKIILVIIFTALLTSGASLALAYREKILQRNGKGRPAIFWNKLKLGLMLIPFVVICAILAEYYVPIKIKINPLNSSESRELTTKERIVNAKHR